MLENAKTEVAEQKRLERLLLLLVTWFQSHARDLPWRASVTPYGVWVSEIMLQQTRVEAVKPYYARFMKELPGIHELAGCEQDRLLKLWEGLGYYNRVRNLQKAARMIEEEYGGRMPSDYETLLTLPGIGSYTAGAIASIAFGQPEPAVDGNVLRVLMRVFANSSDISKQSVRKKTENLVRETMKALCRSGQEEDGSRGNARTAPGMEKVTCPASGMEKETCPASGLPGRINQALMELGATVCVPNGEPKCPECPWREECLARQRGQTAFYPVKAAKKQRRIENRTILIIRDETRVVLRKRPETGLLAGLYEFPNLEGHLSAKEALEAVKGMRLSPLHIRKADPAKHIFTHVEWRMKAYVIRVDMTEQNNPDAFFVEISEQQKKYPVPSAYKTYVKLLSALES